MSSVIRPDFEVVKEGRILHLDPPSASEALVQEGFFLTCEFKEKDWIKYNPNNR
jgi:hypothetical protein